MARSAPTSGCGGGPYGTRAGKGASFLPANIPSSRGTIYLSQVCRVFLVTRRNRRARIARIVVTALVSPGAVLDPGARLRRERAWWDACATGDLPCA
jgi:hypothetical protein